uniref:L2 protein n=1 Tax=Rousettus bat papillomavirus TaxID=3141903 RepID=A0AAU7E309_9PAPI
MGGGRGIDVGAWPRPAYPARPSVPAIETLVPTLPSAPDISLPAIPDVIAPEIIELEPIVPPSVDPSVIDAQAPVGPEQPSVVQDFGNFPSRPAIIDESLGTVGGNRIEVIADVHHPPDLFPVHNTTFTESEAAVLDVGENIPLLPRSLPPHIHDPAILLETTSFGTSAEVVGARGALVDYSLTSESVVDDIPLLDRTYDPSSDLEFRTSTPSSRPRLTTRLKNFYHRFVKQVPVEESLFLEAPGHIVEFGNVAYEPEDTLDFPISDNPLASPDPRVEGVEKLHRAVLSEVPGGRGVRVSRLGRVGAMQMRSGARVGPRVHVYHDISSIGAAEEPIELTPLGIVPHSTNGEIVIEDTAIDVLTEEEDPTGGFEEVPLLDSHAGQTQRVQVGAGGSRNRNPVSLEIPTTNRADAYGINTGTDPDIYVHYPDEEGKRPSFIPGVPLEPGGPTIIVEDDNTPYDYFFDVYLHVPRKKRKRCPLCSLTDGYLDT